MDLVVYLENALENTEKTLQVASLSKEVEDRFKDYRDLIFYQRNIDSQVEEKEKRIFMELEICKVLRKFHEWILEQSFGYIEAVYAKKKGILESEVGKPIKNIEEEHYKKGVSALLSCLYNNTDMAAKLLSFQRSRKYSDHTKNVERKVGCSINRLGLNILKGAERGVEFHSKVMREREDVMLKYEDLKIKNLLGLLKQRFIEHEEAIKEEAISKILLVLSQGSVENDIRFVKLIDETLERTEIYESPEIARMSVQFVIAKKYVEDMISLKEQPFFQRYLEQNGRKYEIR
ncbi:uncharacterized protein Eint_020050 [Encephalitozoon intestinalis ATCC 50506]|uniref:Uncharacterized protein n=1 Tax=Encephalitozoon intestinalis (strain ATCC 50506) TaxID=876142 RepID=E0S5M1_ENCIT|nr:uncharacterized protein Eint_020050 [Encephalitozoon intestinalis ATCC 50506]ADM11006.1 hypothetical protein Eint_020050 [Encephalitozoon intestinalis ATCC 50506]UTX44652.1 hypothetical protein GPK93_02g01670 [Encephalitozoon intestinalis]